MPSGYPDGVRVNRQSYDALVNVSNVNGNPSITYGPFPVAIWQSVVAKLTPRTANSRIRCTFNFYADQAALQQVSSYQYITAIGAPINDSVPCVGSWLKVTVEVATVAPDNTFDLVVSPYSTTTGSGRTYLASGLVSINSLSISPSNIATIWAPYVMRAPITWGFRNSGTAPDVTVAFSVVDLTGASNTYEVARVNGAVTPGYGNNANGGFNLPGGLLRVDFINNNAANNAVVYLVVEPS